MSRESQTWLLIMKSDHSRSWMANPGYDDSVGIYYSYDSNVAHSRKVREGDLVVVRHDDYVAGWGYIERIEVDGNAYKEIRRCPSCRETRWRERKKLAPHLLCDNCGHGFEFPDLVVEKTPVTSFRAIYESSWKDAARPVKYTDGLLQTALIDNNTFHAIRPLNRAAVGRLLDYVTGGAVDLNLDFPALDIEITGGHTTGLARRRRGQREFRFRMMERFGERCAITGKQPPQVLEAAHLYSYAKRPEHHQAGGLLLRRDHHALFDANLLTIHPQTWRLEIAPSLRRFESYRVVAGRELQVEKSLRPDRELIERHFELSQKVFSRHT